MIRKGAFPIPLILCALCALCGGCAQVKPYQRGRLAHPTMLLGDMARPGAAHVYSIREGAVGGGAGAQGGCGCN